MFEMGVSVCIFAHFLPLFFDFIFKLMWGFQKANGTIYGSVPEIYKTRLT